MKLLSVIRMALACAVVAAAAPLQAQAWEQVARGSDGSVVYMDPERVVRSGGTVGTWLRFTYPTVQRLSTGEAYRAALMHVNLDCAGARWQLMQSVFYDAGGRVVSQGADVSPWVGIVPESVLEDASHALCGRTPVAAAAVPGVQFGALAAGRGTGWSVDHATQADADARAVAECGQDCRVIVRIAGPRCGAYATSPTSYGWAVASTRAQAEADALANCERERRAGRPCGVAVWACNGRP